MDVEQACIQTDNGTKNASNGCVAQTEFPAFNIAAKQEFRVCCSGHCWERKIEGWSRQVWVRHLKEYQSKLWGRIFYGSGNDQFISQQLAGCTDLIGWPGVLSDVTMHWATLSFFVWALSVGTTDLPTTPWKERYCLVSVLLSVWTEYKNKHLWLELGQQLISRLSRFTVLTSSLQK